MKFHRTAMSKCISNHQSLPQKKIPLPPLPTWSGRRRPRLQSRSYRAAWWWCRWRLAASAAAAAVNMWKVLLQRREWWSNLRAVKNRVGAIQNHKDIKKFKLEGQQESNKMKISGWSFICCHIYHNTKSWTERNDLFLESLVIKVSWLAVNTYRQQ